VTDRAHSLTVVLERDTRDDDLEPLLTAIRQMRGVVGVEMNIVDPAAYAHETRAAYRTGGILMAVLKALGEGGAAKVLHALEGVEPRSTL